MLSGTDMVWALLAGLVAALIMHGLLRFSRLLPGVQMDMLRVVAAILGRRELGRGLALALHLGLGAIFGLLYAWAFAWFGQISPLAGVLMGSVLGFYHGLAVAFALMYGATEGRRQADPHLYRASWSVGLVHTGAHVVFGAALGFFLAFF